MEEQTQKQQEVVETVAPKEEVKQDTPITMTPHIENVYTLSFNEMALIKQALAPFEYVLSILNATKQRVDSQQGGMVPIFESDVKRTKDQNGNEQVLLKDPENFWKKNTKLKGNSMKVENGELKTN